MNQWQMLHHIISVYEELGEVAAAVQLATLNILAPSKSDPFKDMINRLYLDSEHSRPSLAIHYNRIGGSWAEIERIAGEIVAAYRQLD